MSSTLLLDLGWRAVILGVRPTAGPFPSAPSPLPAEPLSQPPQRDVPVWGHSAMAWQNTPDAAPPTVEPAPVGSDAPARAAHARRFTDMACFTHGDEAELCRYEHAMCFDGERLVLSVPEPPGPRVDSNAFGHVMRELTATCYDFRFYDPEGAEYTGCRYDSPRFHRIKAKLLTDKQLDAPPVSPASAGGGRPFGNAFPQDEPVEQLFIDRDVKSEWAIPLTRRRWGPANRGQLPFREVHGEELFGPDPHDSAAPPRCLDCAPPPPPALPSELRVSHVTQHRNTTATWLDGALWLMVVDADFQEHIYHFSTRILSLFSAQRHNSSQFGENIADGYLMPLSERNHPINATWDLGVPFRRRPLGRADNASLPTADEVNAAGFVEEADAPNRVQYLSGAQFPDIPPIDYVAFTDPSASFPGVHKLLPFLRAMLKLSGQRHTHYLASDVTTMLSPNNLLCSKRGAVVGTHNMFFPSRADAWYFRQTAYDFAGLTRLGVPSHDDRPPPKITIISRHRRNGRFFDNEADLVAAARETGLEVEVVTDLGKLPFKEVVAKMAGTGILVAAHGAALVNAMFLPQHAAVVEFFPYYMKKMTYARLTALFGLSYFPVYTWKMPPKTPENAELYAWHIYENEDFVGRCLDVNVSTIDALLMHACNYVSKHLPIIVEAVAFREVLRDAVDAITATALLLSLKD